MKLAILIALALFAAQPFPPPLRLVVPNLPDLTITTRRTGILSSTSTLYLKGARQRQDSTHEYDNGGIHHVSHSGTITQCDHRRTIMLNVDAKIFLIQPLRTVLWKEVKSGTPLPPRPSGPEVTITIDAVETGEPRRVGPYAARHVVTTIKTDASPGAHHQSGTTHRDGWYIDVPGCFERQGDRSFSFADGELTTEYGPLDQVRVERRGTAREGYAIEQTSRTSSFEERTELIAFSDAPIDATVFETPAGYRAALPMPYGGYDMTRPDTLVNRAEVYWEAFTRWAESWILVSR